MHLVSAASELCDLEQLSKVSESHEKLVALPFKAVMRREQGKSYEVHRRCLINDSNEWSLANGKIPPFACLLSPALHPGI